MKRFIAQVTWSVAEGPEEVLFDAPEGTTSFRELLPHLVKRLNRFYEDGWDESSILISDKEDVEVRGWDSGLTYQ